MDENRALDEIQLLASSSPAPTPTPETVARHRDQLRAAITANPPVGQMPTCEPDTVIGLPVEPESGKRWRTVAAVAAAGAVVVAAGAFVVGREGGGVRPDRAAVATTGIDARACGTALPFEVPIPSGYEGPIEGPGPDSDEPAAPGQVVQHWTSPTGSIEARWPALSGYGATNVETGEHIAATVFGRVAPTGRFVMTIARVLPAWGAGECQAVLVTLAEDDSAAVRAHGEELTSLWRDPEKGYMTGYEGDAADTP